MPIDPNYKKGVGQLVTTRYDFQDHIDGYAFKHEASHVTLSPAVNIGSVNQTNVRDAIVALNNVIAPSFTVPDATTSVKGIIKLAGDLSGTATNVKVAKIQGFSVSALTPNNGQVLTWDNTSSSWKPLTPTSTFIASGDLFGDNNSQTVIRIQGNAVTSAAPSSDKQVLTWIAANSRWEPFTLTPAGTGLATVTGGFFDTNATANVRYTSGRLQIDSGVSSLQWKNGSITGDLTWTPTGFNKSIALPDTNADVLVARNTTEALTNKTINASNNTITDTATAVGDILVSDGTKFTRLVKGSNGTFLGVSGGNLGYFNPLTASTPSGTGFAHLTSGAYDANATANLRYASNKLQIYNALNNNGGIQWLSGSTTGDLSWNPSGGNKSLTLPNANDTLVGVATSDLFQNKTINASNNTINDTGIATGDLLKSNGTKFVRFGIGAALQILRVNSGGTDLEWTAPTSGASSGTINTVQTSNGSGGLNGATNVLAGTNFISFGSGTTATTGNLRFQYNAIDTLMAVKDSGGTDREIISRPSSNKIQFGASSLSAMDVQINGDTIVNKVNSSFSIIPPGSANSALTITGAGTVDMKPSNFAGLKVDLNGSANGANVFLFSAPTVASSIQGVISIGNSTSIPSATPSGGGYLYVDTGALKYKGGSGTLSTIGNADPHCKKCGRDFMHEWVNEEYGGRLATCVPCLLDALEAIGIDVNAFSDRPSNG